MSGIVRHFQLYVLCTGNICRSPIAEAALRTTMPAALIGSAGLRTRNGMLADRRSVDAARRLGLDISQHRSSVAEPGTLSRADLVLTMTSAQAHDVKTVCFEAGVRAPRVATLRAAAWRSRSLAQVELFDDEWLDRLAGVRLTPSNHLPPGGVRRAPTAIGADDIEDPVGRSTGVHRRVAAEIVDAVGELAQYWRA